MKDKLIKLGFSDKEAVVFLMLIQMGPTPASTLARLTQIKRTSIYDILNSLLEKHFIGSFKQGSVQFYFADDLKKIVVSEREKLKTAQEFLQMSHRLQIGSDLQVTYYKGLEGMKELYSDILEARPKELLGWVNLDFFYKPLDPDFESEWTKRRVEKGIHVRLLMLDSPLAKSFQKADLKNRRETRLLTLEEKFSSTCFLYEPYIVFFDTKGEISGVRLQNPEFFKMQKAIFEMNWAQRIIG